MYTTCNMLIELIKNHIINLNLTNKIDNVYEFCRFINRTDKPFNDEMDESFVFYAINDIYGEGLHEIVYESFSLYLRIANENPSTASSNAKQLLLNKLSYICTFLKNNNLWEDIIYPAFVELIETLIKRTTMLYPNNFKTLTTYDAHWKKFITHLKIFFVDSYWNNFCTYINYIIHYFFMMSNISSLQIHLLNTSEECTMIRDYKICLLITQRKDRFIEHFNNVICPRILHIGMKTSTILYQCNLFLANLNDIDDTGELSRIICTPIMDYLKTRKDLIKCVVNSISSNSTFNTDFLRHNEHMAKRSKLITDSNISSTSSDDEDINRPLNITTTTTTRNNAITHNNFSFEYYKPRRKYQTTFDLLNSFIFIYGNAKLFMNEFKTYLQDRIIPFKSVEWLENEKILLQFILNCFGKELVYNCFIMIHNVIDSHNKNYRKYDRKHKVHIDCIIMTPSVWPEICPQEETNIPSYIRIFTNKFEKLFHHEYPHRSLEWFPDHDVLEIDITIGRITKTFLCSPNQGVILVLFNNHVVLSYDDILQKSSINNMDIVKNVVSYWLDIGIIVGVSENNFQLIQSFNY